MKQFFILIFTIVTAFSGIQAQSGACGTQVSQAQITKESSINIVPLKLTESVQQLNIELAVSVYIIKNSEGATGITPSAIQSGIDKVNAAFAPVKLKFRICNTIYVDNYQFDNLSAIGNESQLIIQHHNPNTINLYFVTSIIDAQGNTVSGYTIMPADEKDNIFLSKSSINSNDIVHQFGHLFNLYHTNEIVFGKELVKDSNCSKTGDLCCDTPADPGVGGSIDEKCDYTGSSKDANKQFYVPSTNNYMSLGNDICRCVFTNDQFSRIIYSVLNQKKNLW